MAVAARILVIGDTILNQTLRAEPALLQGRVVPAGFLNEELMHLGGAPETTIQGAAFIARYLSEADPERVVTLLTETRNHLFPGLLRRELSSIGDQAASIFAVEDRSASVSIRVLRDVAASRVMGPQPKYRPQLRIDSPRGPLPAEHGLGPTIESAIEAAFQPLESTDRCLLRLSCPDLIGGYGEGRVARAKASIDRVLTLAQARGVRMMVDLRPLPATLEIRDPSTVICTTIGRLEDAFGRRKNPQDTVAEALWRLSPARILVCFAASQGVWVALRGPLRSQGQCFRIPITWPIGQGDGCGMVTGGDGFVAALLDALDRGSEPIQAASEAAAALLVAQTEPLGASIGRQRVLAGRSAIPAATSESIEDPAGEPVHKLAASLAQGGHSALWNGLVAPEGGRMRSYFSELRSVFEQWRPRPGRDLVAIFGESRSGKEYPLKVALKGLGLGMFGPVNMHQFLAETGGVIRELQRRSVEAKRPLVLVLDEVVPDDASRSLLNLTGEKIYRRYDGSGQVLSFVDNPVVLLSSIAPERLLRDMQGRLVASLCVPPLRERQDEIPFLLPMVFTQVLGGLSEVVRQVDTIAVSVRLMAALLAHDYRPVEGAENGFGLDQQNFRALTDLVAYLMERALERSLADGVLYLRAADLPAVLMPLGSRSLDDSEPGAFFYSAPFDRPGSPRPPQ